jgi:ATP-dependent Lon protease
MSVEATSKVVERVPILPLRNSVLFPMSVVPVNVGRARSVRLVEELDAGGSLVGVVAQRDPSVLEPSFDDVFQVGTLARVVKVIRLNASSYSVVLNGVARFQVHEPLGLEPYMRASVLRAEELRPAEAGQAELRRAAGELRDMMREALGLMPELPKETAGILDNVTEPGALADLIASNFPDELASVAVRQRVLEALSVVERVQLVRKMVDRQLESLRIKGEISHLVATEMTRTQRAYVLRQQLRTIREELGENPDDDDVEALRERLALAEMPEEAHKATRKQLSRLAGMQSQSPEYQVARSYVEWMLDLPWRQTTPDRLEVSEVRRCLDEDHYGLELVKRRIVEVSAVRQLRADNRAPILLFLGPPGVGKTSLGRSIARAMGRRYGRIALGGVRDEAEIRGHRRTYVGALPGRILQAMKKVGSRNPVLVLDEVDKMGVDMRGDPAAALLEVLDPAQNDAFVDHYLEVPFDLSRVTFLCTANYASGIPPALADRLEVVEVPGYTPLEKRAIARGHLIPKQREAHGLRPEQLEFSDEGLDELIESHTREAGVRGLERAVAAVCRELAVRMASGADVSGTLVDRALVSEVMGPPKYTPELAEHGLAPGVGVGLGEGGAGGELVFVEVSRMPGKGGVRVTGSLGPVLEEAAHTAVSFVRSRTDELGLAQDWLRDIDLHVHIPRARAVMDFAGVGLAIFCAVSSLLLGVSCRADVAVLGELTLRGTLLPVHGVKAALLAAHRAGLREVLLPARNEPDVAEVPASVLAELTVRYVHRIDEVLPLVLDPAGQRRRAASPQELEEETGAAAV